MLTYWINSGVGDLGWVPKTLMRRHCNVTVIWTTKTKPKNHEHWKRLPSHNSEYSVTMEAAYEELQFSIE